jgi:phosphodiesterase/alkaline phosphatase D-like protein
MIPRSLQDWELPSGVQIGDVTANRAMVWSAAGREARMQLEVSADERLGSPRLIDGPDALDHSGFTAKLDLGGLTPGEPVFYRVWFEDLATGARSVPVTGRFRAAPSRSRAFTLCWSGDVVGQGWGIDPGRGGLRLYETMARHAPDVFVHSGDQIYADNPLRAEVALDDGTTWRNLVTPAKARVAETLGEFRGNYAYNLLDAHARAFNREVPMIVQWDDHEVPTTGTRASTCRLVATTRRSTSLGWRRGRAGRCSTTCRSARTSMSPNVSIAHIARDRSPRSLSWTSAAIEPPTAPIGRRRPGRPRG